MPGAKQPPLSLASLKSHCDGLNIFIFNIFLMQKKMTNSSTAIYNIRLQCSSGKKTATPYKKKDYAILQKQLDLIIKQPQCVIQKENNLLIERLDIGIDNGKIVNLSSQIRHPAKKTLDASHLIAIPGPIDTQVHFREPGFLDKEDIYHGTKGAILGGITGILEMPNTNPPTTDEVTLEEKLNSANNNAFCHFGFFIGACPQNLDLLNKLENLNGVSGIKIFTGSSTGKLLVTENSHLEKIFQLTKGPIAIHSESEKRLLERKPLITKTHDVLTHPVWRDVDTAYLSTLNLIHLAKKLKRKLHILHISTKQELDLIRNNKKWITAECLPQHLILEHPLSYNQLGTLAQMNPPIREKEHQLALWNAISDNTIDIIASDHAPHTLEEKNEIYPDSPSGMPGVQTLLPIMLTQVSKSKLSLTKLIELISINPCKIYKIQNKGRLEIGYDADITLIDLKKTQTINHSWIASKCKWTPFDGFKSIGWPIFTLINGKIVMNENEVIGPPSGQSFIFKKN